MTHKHFEAIAQVLNNRHTPVRTTQTVTVRAIAEDLAEELSKHNPRFDKERFVKACTK